MRVAPPPVLLSIALAASIGADAFAFQDTTRVSVDSAGAQADDRSLTSSISSDGRYVVFESDAADLVAGDGNSVADVFVHDRTAGTTERVSVDSWGNEGDRGSHGSYHQAISDDGMRVVFQGSATNLDPNDTNGRDDVFVHDRASGTTVLVSVDSSGVVGNANSFSPAISGDGRFVVFTSFASNLVANDNNGETDVFLRDLASGTTELVSVDSAGNQGDGGCLYSSVSFDGQFIAFESGSTNLVAGDTNGCDDVFVRDRQAGTTERVSVDSNGAQVQGFSMWPSVSADGAFVAFESQATTLVPGDDNQRMDIFVRDRAVGATSRVSVDSSGTQADQDSVAPMIDPTGRFVAFGSSSTNLVAGDTNHVDDVFVHDCVTGATDRRSVDSSGSQADRVSIHPSISAGGRVVAFESIADDLVAADTNGVIDVFVHDLCGAVATWTNYGSGLPGTYGVPSFTAQQFPVLGATLTVDLANSLAAPTVGFLVVGFQCASLPTHFGSDLLVLPAVIQPITFSYGGDSFTGTIPDDVTLCGATIDLQGIELDPGAPFGVSFSQGLELTIGN
jgi:Tol biopolymer transport system component